jgi:hypothetical protein
MAVVSRATLIVLCGLPLSAIFSIPASADQGLVLWSASKSGENAANFSAGLAVPVRFDPTLTARTTIAGSKDGGFDPAAVPLGLAASMRLTHPGAMEYGRLARLEMQLDARARSSVLELHDSRIWAMGPSYELRGSRVLTARAGEGGASDFTASQAIELDLERFSATLSTRAFYGANLDRPEASVGLTRRFGETLRIGVSFDRPLREVKPIFDARYRRTW